MGATTKQIMSIVRAIESGTPVECLDEWSEFSTVRYRYRGWIVAVFWDGGGFDYIDHVITPRGRRCEWMVGDRKDYPPEYQHLPRKVCWYRPDSDNPWLVASGQSPRPEPDFSTEGILKLAASWWELARKWAGPPDK